MAVVAALLVLAAGVLLIDDPAAGPASCTPPRIPNLPPAGTVGFPLRLADPNVIAVLRPGQRVDVLAPPEEGAPAVVVATDLAVLRTLTGSDQGAIVYLAARSAQARALASLSPDLPVSVTVRAP